MTLYGRTTACNWARSIGWSVWRSWKERAVWADVRAAWSEAGLAFVVRVEGKRQPPWCRAGRPEDSDGLQIWIDTRDVHNVHRAGRFCQRFIFLPGGGGPATRPGGGRSAADQPCPGAAPTRSRGIAEGAMSSNGRTAMCWKRSYRPRP